MRSGMHCSEHWTTASWEVHRLPSEHAASSARWAMRETKAWSNVQIMPEELHLSVSRKALILLYWLLCEICSALFDHFTPMLWAVSTMILKMDIQNVCIGLYHQRFSVLTSHQLCAVLLTLNSASSKQFLLYLFLIFLLFLLTVQHSHKRTLIKSLRSHACSSQAVLRSCVWRRGHHVSSYLVT